MQGRLRVVLGVALVAHVTFSVMAAPPHGAASPGSSIRATLPGDLIDLNTAPAAELAALPGMGPVYAKRVVEGRPYSAKNQLVTRGVLPASTYEQIRDRVVAHRPQTR